MNILKRNQTALNLITGIGSLVMNLAVSFVLSSYIVKTIGEEANGFAQLANNFVLYASLLTVAFNSMAARFISLAYHNKEKTKVRQYYSSVILCNIVITGCLIPCTYFVVSNLENIVNIENANVIHVKILFACVFVNFFLTLFSSIFEICTFVLNKLYLKNVINAFRSILNAILLISTFSLFKPRIFYISVVALVLSIGILILMLCVKNRIMPELKFEPRCFKLWILKELFFSGIWNVVNQGGHLLMTGMDLLLSNIFVTPAMMGILSVAKTVPNAIFNLAGTINANFAPDLMITYSQNRKVELLNQLRSSMKISSILVSIPLVTFCSFGFDFYQLWMPTLDAKLLTILSFLTCMSFIPWAGPQALYNVFTTANKLKVNSIAFLCTGVLNIILVFWFLKFTNLGILAVAGVSSTLAIIRNLVITVPYTAKLLNLKWYVFYKDVLISLICCGICWAICIAVGKIIVIANWLTLAIAVLISCIIVLIIDVFVILNKNEKKIVIQKILRRK